MAEKAKVDPTTHQAGRVLFKREDAAILTAVEMATQLAATRKELEQAKADMGVLGERLRHSASLNLLNTLVIAAGGFVLEIGANMLFTTPPNPGIATILLVLAAVLIFAPMIISRPSPP